MRACPCVKVSETFLWGSVDEWVCERVRVCVPVTAWVRITSQPELTCHPFSMSQPPSLPPHLGTFNLKPRVGRRVGCWRYLDSAPIALLFFAFFCLAFFEVPFCICLPPFDSTLSVAPGRMASFPGTGHRPSASWTMAPRISVQTTPHGWFSKSNSEKNDVHPPPHSLSLGRTEMPNASDRDTVSLSQPPKPATVSRFLDPGMPFSLLFSPIYPFLAPLMVRGRWSCSLGFVSKFHVRVFFGKYMCAFPNGVFHIFLI